MVVAGWGGTWRTSPSQPRPVPPSHNNYYYCQQHRHSSSFVGDEDRRGHHPSYQQHLSKHRNTNINHREYTSPSTLSQTTTPSAIITSAISNMSESEFLTLIGSSSASNPARSLYRHFRPYIGGESGGDSGEVELLLRAITARCRIMLGLSVHDDVDVQSSELSLKTAVDDAPPSLSTPLPTASRTTTTTSSRRPLIPKHLLFGTKKPSPQQQRQHHHPEVASPITTPPVPLTPTPSSHPPLPLSRRPGLILDMCRLGIPLYQTEDGDNEVCVSVVGDMWDRIMSSGSGLGGESYGGSGSTLSSGSAASTTTVATKKELLVPIITSLNSQWIVATTSSSLSLSLGSTSKNRSIWLRTSPQSSSSLPHPMARHVLHCVNELVALLDLHLEHCQALMDERCDGDKGVSNSQPPQSSINPRRRRSFFRRGSKGATNNSSKRRPPPPLSIRDVIDSLVFLSRCYEATWQFNSSATTTTKNPANLTNFSLSGTSEVDMGYLMSEAHRGVIQCITALSLQLLSHQGNGGGMYIHTQEEDLLSGGGGGLEADDVVTLVSLVRTLQSQPRASSSITTSSSAPSAHSISSPSGGSVDKPPQGNYYLDRLQRTVSTTLGRFNRRRGNHQQLDASQHLDRILIDVLLSRTLEEVWGCGNEASSSRSGGSVGSGNSSGRGVFDFTLSPSQRVSILSTLSEIAPTHALVKTLTTRMAQHAIAHIPPPPLSSTLSSSNGNHCAATTLVLGSSSSREDEMDLYITQLFRMIAAGREVTLQSMDFHAGGALAALLLNRCPLPSSIPMRSQSTVSNISPSTSALAIAIRALAGEERAHRGSSSSPSISRQGGVIAADRDVHSTRLQLSRWSDLLIIQPLHALLSTIPSTTSHNESRHQAMIRNWWDGIRTHLVHLTSPCSPQAAHDVGHLALLLPLLSAVVVSPHDCTTGSVKDIVNVCVVLCTVILSDVSTSTTPSTVSAGEDSRRTAASQLNTAIEVGCLAVLLLDVGVHTHDDSEPTTHGDVFNVLSVALSLVAKLVVVRRDRDSSSRRVSLPPGDSTGVVVVRGQNREHLWRMVETYNQHLPLHDNSSSATFTSASSSPNSVAATEVESSSTPRQPCPIPNPSPFAASVRIPQRSPDTTGDSTTALPLLPQQSLSVQLVEPRVIRTLQAMCY